MRGVVLAGGLGTRMLPATNSINKHLLPVYTGEEAIPMIEFPIRTLKFLGIRDILIISSQEHSGRIIEHLGDGHKLDLDFTYKIQDMSDPTRPPGIASALKICKNFTKREDFVVILGDNYYDNNPKLGEFVKACARNKNILSGLVLYKTNEWNRFGVADIQNNSITKIIEKPKEYISDLAVTGMYYYTKDVYDVAKTLVPSDRGELEISDINDHYVKENATNHVIIESFWSDMGTPPSMAKTQNHIINNEKNT